MRELFTRNLRQPQRPTALGSLDASNTSSHCCCGVSSLSPRTSEVYPCPRCHGRGRHSIRYPRIGLENELTNVVLILYHILY